MVTGRSVGVMCVCALIWLTPSASSAAADAMLERHRSLGKAFFENPTTHTEAIAEFKKALDLAPNSVREKLNYALALLHGNRRRKASRSWKRCSARTLAAAHLVQPRHLLQEAEQAESGHRPVREAG